MDLKTKFAGLEFKNPIVASSGSIGVSTSSLEGSIKAGVAAVTLKSPGLDPETTIYPRPAHLFLRKFKAPHTMINWEGFTISVVLIPLNSASCSAPKRPLVPIETGHLSVGAKRRWC